MKIDVSFHQKQYQTYGLTIVEGFLNNTFCSSIVKKALALDDTQILSLDCVTGPDVLEQLTIRHKLLDGNGINKFIGEIAGIYQSLIPLISVITAQEAMVGRWIESDVNLLIYGSNSLKGPHFDSVPISIVVPLSTIPPKTGVFYYTDLLRVRHEYDPIAGDLLLFQGNKLEHGVTIRNLKEPRVIINANYYLPEDFGY